MLANLRNAAARRPLLLVVSLLLIAAAAVALNRFVQETIAPAILSWAWHVFLMSRGFPQVLTWAFFVAAIPVIAVFSLIQGQVQVNEDASSESDLHEGRVMALSRWLQQAPMGEYFKNRVLRHLTNLSLETIGYRERLSTKETRELIVSGQIQIPPELYNALEAGLRQRNRRNRPDSPSNGRAAEPAQSFFKKDAITWNDPRFEIIVRFLESELEVKGEN
ncbi:MAG: hypothetical protein ACE5E7_12155 [Anaerolineae bacterium]